MFTTTLAISLLFGILMMELMHWRILKQQRLETIPLVSIKDNTFHTREKIRLLRYWFTPDLQPIYHCEVRLQNAKAKFIILQCLARAGKRLTVKTTRALAIGLILLIIMCGL